MQTDTIRLIATYVTAIIVIVGGGAFLLIVRNDVPANDLITGAAISVVTLAVQFVFTKETQTSAARGAERAVAQGAASGSTVTVDPPRTTVTPPAPEGDKP